MNDELAIILFGSAKKIVKFLFGDSNLVKKIFLFDFLGIFYIKNVKDVEKKNSSSYVNL